MQRNVAKRSAMLSPRRKNEPSSTERGTAPGPPHLPDLGHRGYGHGRKVLVDRSPHGGDRAAGAKKAAGAYTYNASQKAYAVMTIGPRKSDLFYDYPDAIAMSKSASSCGVVSIG